MGKRGAYVADTLGKSPNEFACAAARRLNGRQSVRETDILSG